MSQAVDTALPPVQHASFTVTRTYPHPPSRVFFAHADRATVRRWRVESEGFEVFDHTLDFRIGGEEASHFRYGDGPKMGCYIQFQEIVADRRIVFSYRMTLGGQVFSASLVTIELEPAPGGTRLTYVEQGAYFDGMGDAGGAKGREEGTRQLLEALAAELER